MKIASGIYLLNLPIAPPLAQVNCYLIEGDDGRAMIYTGWSTTDAFNLLQRELKGIGLTVADISKVIVTHVHPDHFGLAGKIRHVSPKMELFAHRLEADIIESRYVKFTELRENMSAMLERHGVPRLDIPSLDSASLPALQFVTLTFPDHVLYGGEIISTGVYDLEVIWTPGHSPGHICIYEPESRLLFTGDHILPDITPNIGYHVQSGDDPLGDYICALHKLENLPVEKILPAHKNIFTDLRGRIGQIIEHHKERKEEIVKTIKTGAHNAWEISPLLTWNVTQTWEQMQPLVKRSAVMETVAHLESMRWEGTVNRIVKNNSISYVVN